MYAHSHFLQTMEIFVSEFLEALNTAALGESVNIG